ncbi:glycosyltransferase family 9 protein [Shewanella sp. TC10]|uniref:glycosyltransferase family 9 protein n=1 Tax=Shewanella sp. TC10 TaxID=1419739 RepID=UPI001E63F8AF|nr:glycosyltransferase family 9 protein [Shewanella sp. TC10]
MTFKALNLLMPIISSEQLSNSKRLLFISPFALGDFLYFKTFLIALKHQHPHIEIDIWLDDNRCNTDAWRLSRSKILQQWMQAEGTFNQSYGCTDSTSARDSQIEQANQRNYDIIVCHSPGSKANQFSDIARKISPKAFIVSSVSKAPYRGLLNFVLFRNSDKVYQLDTDSLPTNHHITDRFMKVMNSIFDLQLSKEQMMPNLVVPDQTTTDSKEWLAGKFPTTNGKLFFLNHLSTNTKKDWQLTQLFSLISSLEQTDNGHRYIINVTPENFEEVKTAAHIFSQENNIQLVVFTVDKHFFELPSLIALSDFVITVDTAILHFAFAAKRPLLAMMRQKKPYWAPPESATSHVMYATEGKGHVSDISVDTVFNKYLNMSSHA